MNDDAEMTWAKLNGDWDSPTYRRELAKKGICLTILVDDLNTPVRRAAISKTIDNLIEAIKDDCVQL